jgi:regulator of protease activity HflC (stomatin/prohibitin superfamily)
LGPSDYLKIKDTTTGEDRIEKGPKLLFLGPYDEVVTRGTGTTLTKMDYVIFEDMLTGDAQMQKGPCVWFPGPYHKLEGGRSKTAIALQEDEYVRLQDKATGQRWVKRGKDLVFLEPTWKIENGPSKAWTLKSYEYVRLLDSVTGKVTVHKGESTVFPGMNESLLDGKVMTAVDLAANEYVKILDQTSSSIRVVTGPALVFLGANEKFLDGGKRRAVEVDEEHACSVRDVSTGQLRLVTDKQLFFPGATEEVEGVQDLFKLADHEAVIIKDKDGNYDFRYGDPKRANGAKSRSFFLPPYSELVQLWWSAGLRRAKRDLCIERFDLRPQFMWNEIDCRTQDNVELVLETTIFYEVKDLSKMVRTTGNLPGDIYNQIRSQFIKHVARVTLKGFMEQLHVISKAIFEEDPHFYEMRGVNVQSLEVTKYSCSEKRTSEVLQQIIEETTNRLNRLSKAESENEVNLFKMQGQIEQEKLNAELLEIQHEHTKSEADVAGNAEAQKVAAFIKGLESTVPKLEERLKVWQTLRQNDALSAVSEGNAKLYYTPNDVNLSIKAD